MKSGSQPRSVACNCWEEGFGKIVRKEELQHLWEERSRGRAETRGRKVSLQPARGGPVLTGPRRPAGSTWGAGNGVLGPAQKWQGLFQVLGRDIRGQSKPLCPFGCTLFCFCLKTCVGYRWVAANDHWVMWDDTRQVFPADASGGWFVAEGWLVETGWGWESGLLFCWTQPNAPLSCTCVTHSQPALMGRVVLLKVAKRSPNVILLLPRESLTAKSASL